MKISDISDAIPFSGKYGKTIISKNPSSIEIRKLIKEYKDIRAIYTFDRNMYVWPSSDGVLHFEVMMELDLYGVPLLIDQYSINVGSPEDSDSNEENYIWLTNQQTILSQFPRHKIVKRFF
ncbi:MAG: hypothetical protein WC284_18140 [Candidimonas sp.]